MVQRIYKYLQLSITLEIESSDVQNKQYLGFFYNQCCDVGRLMVKLLVTYILVLLQEEPIQRLIMPMEEHILYVMLYVLH